MLLRSLKLTNILSFGPETEAVELRPLNVLIGANGSGKSNFIDAIGLLHAAPRELVVPIRAGGGIDEWLWKGAQHGKPAIATIDAVLPLRHAQSDKASLELALRHQISFTKTGAHFQLADERLENEKATSGKDKPFLYFGFERGRPMLNVKEGKKRGLKRETLHAERSILAQFRDPEKYPELAFVSDAYEEIAFYREWAFGRGAARRTPAFADLPTDHLLEDTRNLGLILSKYRREPSTKLALIDAIREVFDGVVDFSVTIEGGTVEVFLEEAFGWSTPAARLSDGTLRWFSLLAVLLDPKPPPPRLP